ncbi:MAG: hypothetical protein WCK33_03550 [Phycisphaerae bacterium]
MAGSQPTSPVHRSLCVHCRYVLSGLDPAGRCPECGKPVADSFNQDLLRFASPERLARLEQGLRLAIIAMLAYVGVRTAQFACRLTEPYLAEGPLGSMLAAATGLFDVLLPLCTALAFFGTWRFRHPFDNAWRTWRVPAAIAAAVAVALGVLAGIGQGDLATTIGVVLLREACFPILVAALAGVATLARRVPDAPLTVAARSRAGWLSIAFVLLVLEPWLKLGFRGLLYLQFIDGLNLFADPLDMVHAAPLAAVALAVFLYCMRPLWVMRRRLLAGGR